MCEFNYHSWDYLCGDCDFQSLLDAKHNMACAGVALLFAGNRLAEKKVFKRFQQGCWRKSSQPWILNDPKCTLVHLKYVPGPGPLDRKYDSCIIYREWEAVMVLTLDLWGVLNIAGLCFDPRRVWNFPFFIVFFFPQESNGFVDTLQGLLDHCQMWHSVSCRLFSQLLFIADEYATTWQIPGRTSV